MNWTLVPRALHFNIMCGDTVIYEGVTSELQGNALVDAHNQAMEQKRLEIWANAPDQPDIQEAVIKKLDLVHRHAIAAALAKVKEGKA